MARSKEKKEAFVVHPPVRPVRSGKSTTYPKWPKKPVPFSDNVVTNYKDLEVGSPSLFRSLKESLTNSLIEAIVKTLIKKVEEEIDKINNNNGEPDEMPKSKNIIPDGDGSSRSSYSSLKALSPELKVVHQTAAKLTQKFVTPYRKIVKIGCQDALCLGVNNAAHLNVLFNRAIVPNTGSLNITLFHTHSWLCLTNQSKTTTFLEIYEMICRDSTTIVDPVTLWKKGLQENQKLQTTMMGAAPRSLYQGYRNSPFLSPPFCETYKIEKVYRVEMPQRRSHIHDSTYFINSVQRSDRAAALGSGGIEGVSHYLLMVLYGSPVTETQTSNPTSSSCDVSIIHDITLNYAIPDDKSKRTYVQNSIQTGMSETFVNTGSGQTESEPNKTSNEGNNNE